MQSLNGQIDLLLNSFKHLPSPLFLIGDVTMEKVKVTRYVTGKRPDYAPDISSGEEDEDEEFFQQRKTAQAKDEEEKIEEEVDEEQEIQDRRLQRLQQRERIASDSEDEEDRLVKETRIFNLMI
jgi:microfibrillar-associated protein 1